ncbi:MAG: hypothetical protein M3272_05840 [Actinomycetota bacterium]|nr:hypothetical protein [Actinomycetota bacterium]
MLEECLFGDVPVERRNDEHAVRTDVLGMTREMHGLPRAARAYPEEEGNVSSRCRSAPRRIENGITHLMLGFTGPNYDLAPLKELIAWRDSRNGG